MADYCSNGPPCVPPHANPRPGIFKIRRTTIQPISRVPTVPTHGLNRVASPNNLEKQQTPVTVESKKSLQRLVKRFSIRPPAPTVESTEPKRRVSMLSQWRRRRSSLVHDRDRSPLRLVNTLQTPIVKDTKSSEGCAISSETGWLKFTFRDLRRRSNLFTQSPKASEVTKTRPKTYSFVERRCQHPAQLDPAKEAFTPSGKSHIGSSSHFISDPNPSSLRQSRIASPSSAGSPKLHSPILNYPVNDEASASESGSLSLGQCVISETDSLSSSSSPSVQTMPMTEVMEMLKFRSPSTQTNHYTLKPVGQDSGWSSELSSLCHPADTERSEEFVEKQLKNNPVSIDIPESCDAEDVCAVWASRLRKSLDRAQRRCRMSVGQTLFNRDPVEGIRYFLDHHLVASVPVAIARLLMKQVGFSRQAIGDYFGSLSDPMSTKVLREFLSLIDMKDREVDESIRSMLTHFHPAGESQKISHLVQVFQEVYTTQNPELVAKTFQSKDTIEVLAYSILMLHTDLHNPSLRRLGQRMTESEFVNNNRGIDAGADLPVDMLQRIYRRVAVCEFKTLPDPVDRLRRLDTMLVGPLKTDNFIQRHRRFVGWVAGQQLNRISTRNMRHHNHWRYLLVFNDILILAKPVFGALLGTSGSLWNMAATTTFSTDPATTSTTNSPKKGLCFSDEPMNGGVYQVRLVLPLKDTNVLVFETQYNRYGLRLCNQQGPVLNFAVSSAQGRQKLIDWIHSSIAELNELNLYHRLGKERMARATLTRSQNTVLFCATGNTTEKFVSCE